MEAHIRISVKERQRDKNLKIQPAGVPLSQDRPVWVWMNGQPWPKDRRPVSLTRLLTALRMPLVKSVQAPQRHLGRR
jgi:hypothetical protein